MIQECPNLIQWDNGRIVITSPKDLEAKLPEFFRHGKFTSFQRQLNKFGFRVEKHGGTKGACVYTRDDLTGQPIEALLGIQKRNDGPGVNGALTGRHPSGCTAGSARCTGSARPGCRRGSTLPAPWCSRSICDSSPIRSS